MADRKLFVLVTILICCSIILVYSMSEYVVLLHKTKNLHFFLRQIVYGFFSIILMFLLAKLDPKKDLPIIGTTIFIISTIAMVVMPFLPESLVHSVGGAKRWIKIAGISIAPVEFFKIGFIWFLAWSFSRKINHSHELTLADEAKRFAPYGFVFIFVFVMIAFIQNDFGQVIVLGTTLMIMITYAGGSLRFFGALLAVLSIGGFIAIVSKSHRIERIKQWWAMIQDGVLNIFPPSIAEKLRVPIEHFPYQVGHSLNAIHNGGLFGEGLADGGFKLGFLSDVHTDFILSGTAEEFGFFGVLFVVIVFLLVLQRIFKIANRSENKTVSLFALGIAMELSFSFLINAYGISGLIPIKGIAVPFLSYGGSSMVAESIAIGMLLMASKDIDLNKKLTPKEFS